MFHKILVSLDQSPMSQTVFENGLDLARTLNAELQLLHVLSGEEPDSPRPIPPVAGEIYWAPGSEINLQIWKEQWDEYVNRCLEGLQAFVTKAEAAGVTTIHQQIPGSAGRVICDLAASWGADLIVVGNRGRSGLKQLLLGSVSNYVLHHAPCSVLIVRSLASKEG
ncbi:MAG: universal stress protein [Leptolyngbyaceae cyanobacterium]